MTPLSNDYSIINIYFKVNAFRNITKAKKYKQGDHDGPMMALYRSSEYHREPDPYRKWSRQTIFQTKIHDDYMNL